MKEIRKKIKAFDILMAISSALLLICAAILGDYYIENARSEALLREIYGEREERAAESRAFRQKEAADPVIRKEPDEEKLSESELYPGFYERLFELKGANRDFFGWLYAMDGRISYPVMKGPEEDRDHYLKRDFYGEPSVRGCLYTDSSSCHIIYGHNMKDGSMFGELDMLSLVEPGEKLQRVKLYIPREDGRILLNTYETVASFTATEKNFKTEGFLKMIRAEKEEDKKELIKYLRDTNKAAISEKINDYSDLDFLTMVTCEYSEADSRLFVVAKKISQWTKCIKKGTII